MACFASALKFPYMMATPVVAKVSFALAPTDDVTQLREENCTKRKKKLGLGVSPSQRSAVHTFGRKHSFIACIVLHELSLK